MLRNILKHITIILVALFFTNCQLYSQKVGLVLSGGGAKGATHIGVIRALEENGIPIDYIAGSSIGAVIGVLYSMGYSPDEMENLITSPEFLQWKSGKIDEKSIFYFKRNDPTPEMLTLKLNVTDSLKIKSRFLPRSLIKSTQINIVFMQLCAQANAVCKSNFDSLMVPFRCIASDIDEKKAIVMKNGDLGDAVRASMSFPLVFRPVEVNGKMLYDGGIYDNFPVRVMEDEFKPDYLIGISVADEIKNTSSESNIVEQIENMILNRNEPYQTIDGKSMIISFRYKDVGLLDFGKAIHLSQIGYDSTISHIDEIKKHVHSNISIDSLNAKREKFKSNYLPLIFKNVWVDKGTIAQRNYIRKNIGSSDGSTFSFDQLKTNYFKLLSDSKLRELYIHSNFNQSDSTFDLIVKPEVDDNVKVSVGGNLSISNVNQLYLGLEYKNLYTIPYSFSLNGQVGYFYKGASFNARTDFMSNLPFYLKLNLASNSYSFYDKNFFDFTVNNNLYSNAEEELFAKTKIGFPFLRTAKLELSTGYGKRSLEKQVRDLSYNTITQKGFVLSGLYDKCSYTVKQYPIAGSSSRIAFNYVLTDLTTSFKNTTKTELNMTKKSHYSTDGWIQVSAMWQNYFKINRHFIIGSYAEGLYSSLQLSKIDDNDVLMNIPAFHPTKHSFTVYNPYLRSDAFMALGCTPILKFTEQMHIRFENYLFAPWSSMGIKIKNKDYEDMVYLSEVNLVAHVNNLNLSLFVNYYSKPQNNFNFGINLGYLLFNNSFIER